MIIAPPAAVSSLSIQEIDTSTDLNTTTAGAVSKEYTIAAADMLNNNYVAINILATMKAKTSGSSNSETGAVSIKIETKEIGGSYSIKYNEQVAVMQNFLMYAYGSNTENNLSYIHTLTNEEKADGLGIKITVTLTETNGGSGEFANNQIQLISYA